MAPEELCSDRKLIKRLLIDEKLSEPLVFDGFINHWEAITWSPESLSQCKHLVDENFMFRVYEEYNQPERKHAKTDVLWENNSNYVSCSLEDFISYASNTGSGVEGDGNCRQKLLDKRRHKWAYADYKHMHELFESQMLEHIDWGVFGFDGRNGTSSTFWLGSEGAYTPCHYDTYGCNLVAQLFGRKKWIMFPPSDTTYLYPTRLPFEESSVFSSVNIQNPCYSLFPKYKKASRYEVVLEPGQVLYVPKHWWHYVECESTAISVNTWIELESDEEERVCEALASMLTKSFADYSGLANDQVYNPKEIPMKCDEGIPLLNTIIRTSVDRENTLDMATSNDRCDTKLATCTCCKRTVHHLKPSVTKTVTTEHKDFPKQFIAQDIMNAVTHPDVLKLMKNILYDNMKT